MGFVDTVSWRLKDFLKENGISTYALVQVSGLAQNTVYALARGATMHVRLDTLAGILGGLRKLTGRDVTLADVLVHDVTPDPEPDPKDKDVGELLVTSTAELSEALENLESKHPLGEMDEWFAAFDIAAKREPPK